MQPLSAHTNDQRDGLRVTTWRAKSRPHSFAAVPITAPNEAQVTILPRVMHDDIRLVVEAMTASPKTTPDVDIFTVCSMAGIEALHIAQRSDSVAGTSTH